VGSSAGADAGRDLPRPLLRRLLAKKKLVRIDYVPGHVLQASPKVFEPRKPLGPKAKRAGWTGFIYNLENLPPIGIARVYASSLTAP
jgi:hypothetical protein